MQVSAISLAEINLESLSRYRADLSKILDSSNPDLAVLPAYSALALGLGTGAFMPGPDFGATFYIFSADNEGWNDIFLDLHANLAREKGLYLAAGTTVEREGSSYYHTAYCFDPAGELCCRQRQTHLSQIEREYDFSRGEELDIFELEGPGGKPYRAGLVVGNDARHPEVGRILALRGADLVLHSGALDAGPNCWAQAAGMWSQVQQNQFFAVEAQLYSSLEGLPFEAASAVLGPCEITPGKSGYLARGYPQTPAVTAGLDEEARQEIKNNYPVLELLNRGAFSDLVNLYYDPEESRETERMYGFKRY